MKADIHSHILCGIDDGARNLEETAAILRFLHQSGVTHLAFTPHYYPSQQPLARFLEKRQAAFEQVLTLPEAKHFAFSLGAEVYFTPALMNQEDLSDLCYSGTNLMLTELETKDRFSSAMKSRLTQLLDLYGIRPVLAHIDRYDFLKKDVRLLSELQDMGCLFQVNLSAFSSFFSSMKMISLAKKGFLDFLGEDLHRVPRSPAGREAMLERLEKKSRDMVRQADREALNRIFR